MRSAILATVLAAGLAAAAAPAWAQSDSDKPTETGWYGSLGYTLERKDQADLNVLNGRFGARLLPYFGLEGEAYFGVGTKDAPGFGGDFRERLDHGVAGYAVGYLPLGHGLDLFVRGGYGTTLYTVEDPSGLASHQNRDSLNFGGGVQYLFDGANGLRLDYTRREFIKSPLSANDWGISYVHHF